MRPTSIPFTWRGFTVLGLALSLQACAASERASTVHAPAPAHWTYEPPTGPDTWGTLDASYFAAAKGRAQSPIDISTTRAIEAGLPGLAFATTAVPLRIVNNGHTVQVNCAAGNTLKFGDQAYALPQFHFHSPSEHTLDGRHGAIEMHLVHKSADGQLAVVGVMIREGRDNPNFRPVWANLPTSKGPERAVPGVTIDPGSLLPADRGYFFYDGSLTTPPCSEGVRWFMLKSPLEMSGPQIADFRKIHEGNNRPVQAHHARLVLRTP